MSEKSVLIPGGQDNFGKRIVEGLLDLPDTTLQIAVEIKTKPESMESNQSV